MAELPSYTRFNNDVTTSVLGRQWNTVIQGGGGFFNDIRAFVGYPGMIVMASGTAAINDGGQGFFEFIQLVGDAQPPVDDNATVLRLSNPIWPAGYWQRLSFQVGPAATFPVSLQVLASENLAAFAVVNLWNNAGAMNVRNANATDNTKPVDGWVTQAWAQGQIATVYAFALVLGGYSGLTAGLPVYLANTAGGLTQTAGNPSQLLGKAVSATQIIYAPQQIIGGV